MIFLDAPLLTGLPTEITLYDLFKNFLTIQAVPKRYFFELLSHFTTSELEEERLLEFCSLEGQVSHNSLFNCFKSVIAESLQNGCWSLNLIEFLLYRDFVFVEFSLSILNNNISTIYVLYMYICICIYVPNKISILWSREDCQLTRKTNKRIKVN